jgi:putative DNA primase/helicase
MSVEDLKEFADRKRAEGEIWRERLIRSDKGPTDCIANAVMLLRSDPAFKKRLRFDEMLQAVCVRDLPWSPGPWREWTDTDDKELANWAQLRGVPLKKTTCADGVALVASHHKHHGVREYLDSLVWDGEERLSTWLTDYLGAAKTDYVKGIARAWPISAVARIYRPGCKADCVLILEGSQGIGKSTAIAVLAGEEWFTDEIADLGTKDSAQDLRGKWIIEMSELSAMGRSVTERIKAFLSRKVDHYRPSYGTRSRDFPRQCVFAGTTNAEAYLPDETGARRFWPVKVACAKAADLARDRDQLWAEAVAAYQAEEQWWLSAELEAEAALEQDERRQADPWEGEILAWLAKPHPKTEFTVGEILLGALGREPRDWSRTDQMRVSACLKALEYKRCRASSDGPDGKRPWVYRKT